jgi:hypothetical protein
MTRYLAWEVAFLDEIVMIIGLQFKDVTSTQMMLE